MKISLNGLKDLVTTLYITEDVKTGDIVSLSDEMTVDAAATDDIFTGICVNAQQGIASVKITGYTELPYSGTAPSLGITFLKADGNGGVAVANAGLGRNAIVVGVDTAEKIVKFILF